VAWHLAILIGNVSLVMLRGKDLRRARGPLAALVIATLAVREGRAAWQGDAWREAC